MSACLRGDVNETLMNDKYDEARRLAGEYVDMFGTNNFFLEIQDHQLEEDKRVMPLVYKLIARNRHPDGRDQRRALSAARRRPHARDHALHPDGQDHVRLEPDAVHDASSST